jgi:hypothetical protein
MTSIRPASDDPRLAAALQARTIEAAYHLLPPGLLVMAVPFALLFRRAASTWAIVEWVVAPSACCLVRHSWS